MEMKMFLLLFLLGFFAVCSAQPMPQAEVVDWMSYLQNQKVFTTTISKKYILVENKVHWTEAQESCETLEGGKLAEPKTEAEAEFLASVMESEIYWIGGKCIDCSFVTDDKWIWDQSKTLLPIDHQMWKTYDNTQLPYDDGVHNAFYLSIEKDEHTDSVVTFVNFAPTTFPYICELP